MTDDAQRGALAREIRAARRRTGLSQQQVADRTAIPRSALSAIERGRRKIGAVELKRVADATGVSIETLLGEDGGPSDTALARLLDQMDAPDRDAVLRYAGWLRFQRTGQLT
jgi:transcriptional regulator with XRE-family HTH domain